MTANIGHNNPPSAFQLIESKINDLYNEALLWLDGEAVTNQEQADEIQKLMRLIQAAEKEADDERKAEAKPFDDAKAEIQSRYNILIGKTKSVTGKTVKAIDVCKKALAPFLLKQENERRDRELAARKEAEEKARIAQEAMRERSGDNLEQNELAEHLVQDAKAAEASARKIANEKIGAKGLGRAATLRTYYSAEVVNYTEFARYAWLNCPDEMRTFLDDLAGKLVARGNHNIAGVKVNEDRRVA